MRRALLVVAVASGMIASGCGGGVTESRMAALEARVTTLETDEHATKDKLQALLVWVNHREQPNVGLYDWMGSVQNKLWPTSGPGDPVRPASPPPPF